MMPSVADENCPESIGRKPLGDPKLTRPSRDDEHPSDGPTDSARAADAPTPSAHRSFWSAWQPPDERALFSVLMILAAMVRLVGLGLVEPNVSAVEVSNLAAIETLIVRPDSGLLGWAGAGASGLALLPAALLRVVHPEPELALRLYAALGSLAFIGLFYVLCRTRFAPLVSLTTTALLAFSPWSVFFGRNGELNAFVGAWGVAAALVLERAMRGGGAGRWLQAGALAAIGMYWHPSALWLLPALAVPIVWAAVEHRAARPRLIIALCVFLAAGLIVAAPRLAGLIGTSVSTAGVMATQGVPAGPDTPVRTRAQQTIRAFLLLDPTATGEQRYQEPGRAPLDGLTGPLLLAGIVLAAWHLPWRVLPVALFLIPLAASQIASPRAPALGDAFVALPGLYLLVADAVQRLVTVLPFPTITRSVMIVAIPAYAVFGWHGYAGWIGSAASAQARQPALDYDEVDAWVEEQRDRLGAGQPAATAQAWREQHARLATGSRVVRRPRGTAPAPSQPDLAQLQLRSVASVAGESGPRAPRSAAGANGAVYVSDAAGRVSRLDAEMNALVPLPSSAPPIEQPSDLVADADGNVYIADAERSVLLKLSPTGQSIATMGGDWGMYRPRGLAIGPDGRLYVADTGRNRIAVGSTDGRFQKAIVPPQSWGVFEQPTEVAVDQSGRIYVGLPEIGKLAILDESGQVLGGWTVPKGNTIESSRFAVVADGVIAVSEPSQGKVRLFDADGRDLAVADVTGRPLGIAVANDRLVVAEPVNGRLLLFSLTGP